MQRLRPPSLGVADAVTDHPQLAPGGDLRVLLPQRPGRRVAWIGERRLAIGHQGRVERLEILDTEEDLAAHLEDVRDRIAVGGRQSVRDVVDGARVERDVLTGATVATGDTAFEDTVAVHERQRDTVDLEFAEELDLGTGVGVDPLDPGGHLVVVEDVVQRHHPLEMVDRGESGGETAADQFCRRVGRRELGVTVLEVLQAS